MIGRMGDADEIHSRRRASKAAADLHTLNAWNRDAIADLRRRRLANDRRSVAATDCGEDRLFLNESIKAVEWQLADLDRQQCPPPGTVGSSPG